ncbi:unnamed protein product [Musa acuminata var. zebrina]
MIPYTHLDSPLCSGLIHPPQRPKPLSVEGRLVRDHHQQHQHQQQHPPRRAPRRMYRLPPRPRQPEHEPAIPHHVAGDDDERGREEEEEEPEAGLGAPHLRLVVPVPRHGQEKDDDGEYGDELRGREGEGGKCLLSPSMLPLGSSPLREEPRHGRCLACLLSMALQDVSSLFGGTTHEI